MALMALFKEKAGEIKGKRFLLCWRWATLTARTTPPMDARGHTTSGRRGVDTDPFAGTSQSFESNDAIDFGKQGVVLSHADIVPWMQFGSQLPHEYIAC
jgi:hypothetical protein